MKTLLRIAAVLSFSFCCVSGLLLVRTGLGALPASDAVPIAAVGLIFIGIAFFVGAILLFAAERVGRKHEGA
jgi:hypothetical protein